tara:strand:+ start:2870 stop:4792 length:1923 start_codon:yes stop_codon:yes gene_type:complete
LWPTDASKTLTAVFGELRPRRYHAGFDVRTYGLSGHNLFAIDDGYIERIRVSSKGYGKAIYLRLKDKRIAVYAHLSNFTPPLDELAKKIQEKNNTYTINQILEPNKYIVKKGDIIGYTGDTGSISGPHLHFEIRDKNNKPINPLLTNYEIKDTSFPVARNLAVIPLEEGSAVNKSIKPITLPIEKNGKNSFILKKELNIFGPFGFAIQIFDKIDNQPFDFGLFGLELYVDNEKFYSIKYDQFDFNEGDLVYTEKDYSFIKSGEGIYYRLFRKNKQNSLSFYGKETINSIILKEGEHEFTVYAFDYNNNKISISGKFNVNRINQKKSKGYISSKINKLNDNCHNCIISQYENGTIISVSKNDFNLPPNITFFATSHNGPIISMNSSEDENFYEYIFNPTDINEIYGITFSSNHINLNSKINGKSIIPGKPFEINYDDKISVYGYGDTFYDTTLVWIRKKNIAFKAIKTKIVSGPFEVGPDLIPYKNQIDIEFKYDSKNIKDNISIYYFNRKNQSWYYMPTTIENNINFKTSALSGEIFALISELDPPKISNIYPPFEKIINSKKENQLSFNVMDDFAGIDGENDIEIIINNNKVIHEYNSYRKEVRLELNGILNHGKNSIEIIISDRVGNLKKIIGDWTFK